MRQVKRVLTVLVLVAIGIGGATVITSGHISTVLGLTPPQFPALVPGADLTAGALPQVKLTAQDPAEKSTVYEVRVKNMTAGPVPAKSLVVVVDRVTDNRNGEDVGHRVEVMNADGHTQDGKSYYRVEADHGQWLAPAEKAKPIRVKLRERDKVPFFTPSFRVREVPAQDWD